MMHSRSKFALEGTGIWYHLAESTTRTSIILIGAPKGFPNTGVAPTKKPIRSTRQTMSVDHPKNTILSFDFKHHTNFEVKPSVLRKETVMPEVVNKINRRIKSMK